MTTPRRPRRARPPRRASARRTRRTARSRRRCERCRRDSPTRFRPSSRRRRIAAAAAQIPPPPAAAAAHQPRRRRRRAFQLSPLIAVGHQRRELVHDRKVQSHHPQFGDVGRSRALTAFKLRAETGERSKLPPLASRVRRTRRRARRCERPPRTPPLPSRQRLPQPSPGPSYSVARAAAGVGAETAKPPSAADHRPLPFGALPTRSSEVPMETSLAGCGRAVGSPSALNPGARRTRRRGDVTPRRRTEARKVILVGRKRRRRRSHRRSGARPDPDPPPPAAVPTAPSPRNLAASLRGARAGIGAGTLADPAGFRLAVACAAAASSNPESGSRRRASERLRRRPGSARRFPGGGKGPELERPLPARPAHPPPIKPPLSSPATVGCQIGKILRGRHPR